MKKALIFSILILFLFNSIGYYFLYELSTRMVRKEMQSVIHRKSSKIITLVINHPAGDRDFRRVDNKEFIFKGSMYDIVNEINTAKRTIFICLHDTRESRLVAGLKNIALNKLCLAMWDHLTMIFLSAPSLDLSPSVSSKFNFPSIDIEIDSSLLPTWSPPPEFS